MTNSSIVFKRASNRRKYQGISLLTVLLEDTILSRMLDLPVPKKENAGMILCLVVI